MSLKMKVAVVEQFGKPLQLLEWDVPSPGTGQILIKTEAAAYAIPISMPRMATGWRSPRFPSFPAMKPSGWSPALDRA
jgi:Zn-dependent alcohol dehydrogenase